MTPKQLVARVAAHFDLDSADLTGQSRMRHVVLARQSAAWVLRKAYAISLEEIGRLLGGRDHTTIGYSIAQVELRIADDAALRAELHSLLPQRPPCPAPARERSDHAMRWWATQARDSYFVRAA
jgi:chromosomal replication initiator protein